MAALVNIYNQALIAIGTRSTISSVNEPSIEAKTLTAVYDTVRRTGLRGAPWNFASKFVNPALLKALPGTPENPAAPTLPGWQPAYPPPPWLYTYVYPPDCLLVRRMIWAGGFSVAAIGGIPIFPGQESPAGLPTATSRFMESSDVDGQGNDIKVICSMVSRPVLQYTKDITNTELWDDTFTQMMIFALAAFASPQLQGDPKRQQMNLQSANQKLIEARVSNGNEAVEILDIMPASLIARGNGLEGFFGTAPMPYGPAFAL